jgi:1-phosphatidylinositol-4-phosphate 5-kinase
MSDKEYKFFRKLLPSYYEHIITNKNTLITRLLGFHKIIYSKKAVTRRLKFIVMGNSFPQDIDIHQRFDLKGSLYKRSTKETEDMTIARKDLDFLNQNMKVSIGTERKELILE